MNCIDLTGNALTGDALTSNVLTSKQVMLTITFVVNKHKVIPYTVNNIYIWEQK